MKQLSDILTAAGVRRALVIDDAYDPVPLASDIGPDFDGWDIFFADTSEDDISVLREIYPGYEGADSGFLRTSNDFIAALWKNRSRMSESLINPLFQTYEDGGRLDQEPLQRLITQLQAHGLVCETVGRNFIEKAKDADLIVIDLFLGSSQDESAQGASMGELLKLLKGRSEKPPLVILMSRSPRIEGKRAEFRDNSGLFESIFSHIRKDELADENRLARILHLLAKHYADSLKLVRFVNAWEEGIERAGKETSRLIRRLDLSAHANIKHLILDHEEQPTGSYLVDVFDRVLQHEFEADAAIIDAAIDLNSLTDDAYPPPHSAEVLDLQDLVHRSLFQNVERLRLKGSLNSPVAFGDVLRRKRPSVMVVGGESSGALKEWPGEKVGNQEVLVVLTPACDLQRLKFDDLQSILFLVGTLKPLAPSDWYPTAGDVTPAVILTNGDRFSIEWDPKHFVTIQPGNLSNVLSSPDGLEIIARLRETHALELKQRLLSNLGRVGQVAAMPSTFQKNVEAYYPGPDGNLAKLDLPDLSGCTAVCYKATINKKEVTNLILNNDLCDAIDRAIRDLDPAHVYDRSREALVRLKSSNDLWLALKRVLPLTKGASDLVSPDSPDATDPSSKNPKRIGLITSDPHLKAGTPLKGAYLPTDGIVLAIREITTLPEGVDAIPLQT